MHEQLDLNLGPSHGALRAESIAEYLISLNVGKRQEIEAESRTIERFLTTRFEKDSRREKRFKFIDLFAGVGGVRLGFERVGGECVMTSEIDAKAQATYFCNFGERVSKEFSDITNVRAESVPDHDVLLGGFPCQAFSVAGERKGFQDTRGTLFFDIQRIIAAKRPKAVLLENVKGLLNHDGGKTFRVIRETLEDVLGYQVYFKVLNTMEYGNIPQTRERVYIVAFDKKVYGEDADFEFPKPQPLRKDIHSCLESKSSDESLYYDKFSIHNMLKKQITKADTLYQWRRIYVRENKSNACPTLTANMGTGGHNVPLILEKGSRRIRKLSPRECANFQGFPKGYYIPKFIANSHLYKQFGNSVSVPVIERIADRMANVMLDAGRV